MTTANTWPDPYLVSSLHDPRIEQTIHGLSRKVQIHALSSAIHGLSLVRGLRTTDTCNRAASLMSSCTHSFVRVHDCEVQQWQSNVIINDIAKSSMPQQCSMMRTSTGSFVRHEDQRGYSGCFGNSKQHHYQYMQQIVVNNTCMGLFISWAISWVQSHVSGFQFCSSHDIVSLPASYLNHLNL